MWLIAAAGSLLLILLVLIDGFEATILPRQVMHRWRFVRLYYRITWPAWRRLGLLIPSGKTREGILSWFGPMSLLGLFATWMLGLMFGFALLNWSFGTALHSPDGDTHLGTYLYMSGVTIFTLGYGDVTPLGPLGRFVAVVEAGTGFGFLAVLISYLPVLYQAFSRREVTISLLDTRAGSPPTASQVLLRLARSGNMEAVAGLLAEWERWSAELLESHLSYPVLGYYRSQHDNQSWLAAVTAMLDTCTLLLAGVKCNNPYQAQLTFAMARHAVVDLTLVLKLQDRSAVADRLPTGRWQELRQQLLAAGLDCFEESAAEAKLAELRGMYEPFVSALARHFLFTLPEFVPTSPRADNWQTSAWMPRTPGIGSLTITDRRGEHF